MCFLRFCIIVIIFEPAESFVFLNKSLYSFSDSLRLLRVTTDMSIMLLFFTTYISWDSTDAFLASTKALMLVFPWTLLKWTLKTVWFELLWALLVLTGWFQWPWPSMTMTYFQGQRSSIFSSFSEWELMETLTGRGLGWRGVGQCCSLFRFTWKLDKSFH